MSMRAAMVAACKAWGQKPSDAGLCVPDDDMAYIIAWEQAENRMMAWERQEGEREARRGKNRA